MPAFRIYDGLEAVKPILLLAVLVCPLHADLIAHVQTTAGNVDVILQYQKAPQAVANFIGLAQGTRARIHPETGAVIQSPMYVGETFYRIVNESSFKIAQTGSGTGDNSGGPGYTFKDEFDPTLTHVPYVLSMANSGPNTNGSQIFFTGNATISHLNNVHTVFGLITDLPSRGVIDAIHSAGSGGSSITGITFSRTDAAALAFNEHDQNLPTVRFPAGNLSVERNVSATWQFNSPITTGDVFRCFRSTTLASNSWDDLNNGSSTHIGIGSSLNPPQFGSITLDTASAPSAFYNLSLVNHPNSYAPSDLANRILAISAGGYNFYYNFSQNGNGGTLEFVANGSNNPGYVAFKTDSFESSAHGFTFIVEQGFTYPNQFFMIKVGCDFADETVINGRNSTSNFIGGLVPWDSFGSGEALITR